MWLLNGKRSTTYAAAWTLVNAHELAIISGMAAAYTVCVLSHDSDSADLPIATARSRVPQGTSGGLVRLTVLQT